VHGEFLRHFMDADRRAIEATDRAAGKDPNCNVSIEELRVLVIDAVDDFVSAVEEAKPENFAFVHATSGGEGLDRISSAPFHRRARSRGRSGTSIPTPCSRSSGRATTARST
jgi:hypothetical protein